MRVKAKLQDVQGRPLVGRKVELLTSEGAQVEQLDAEVSNKEGIVVFSCRRPTLPVLGLRVDGRPVVVVPNPLPENAVDLGVLVVSESPLFASTAFPCEKVCYGLPAALYAPADPQPVAAKRTVSAVVSDTALQLEAARSSVEKTSTYTLGQVSITMKGVLGEEGDRTTLSLAPDSVLDAAAYSEVAFVLDPRTPAGSGSTSPTEPTDPNPDDPTAPRMPDLRGYTRALAERKLAQLGLAGSFDGIAVDPTGEGARQVGRVVTQLPPPDAPLGNGRVRLFLGRAERSA